MKAEKFNILAMMVSHIRFDLDEMSREISIRADMALDTIPESELEKGTFLDTPEIVKKAIGEAAKSVSFVRHGDHYDVLVYDILMKNKLMAPTTMLSGTEEEAVRNVNRVIGDICACFYNVCASMHEFNKDTDC